MQPGRSAISPTPSPTPEQPREVKLTVVTRGTEEPVANAEIRADDAAAVTAADGTATITAMRGADVEVQAEGHDLTTATVPDEGELDVEMRPNTVTGVVTDPDGTPIAGVRVFMDGSELLTETDEDGAYELAGLPADGVLIYKMPGYRLVELTVGDELARDITMEPFEARALYAPSAIFEGPGRLDEMLSLLDRTEANALVIDVKETDGRLYYATDLPSAVEVGAVRETPVFDLEELLPMLKERGIYTIARMVSMKDNTSALARPELAVRNSDTGEPWRDNIGGAWLDPSAPGGRRVPRQHRGRPRRQGLRRGADGLHPLLQRRSVCRGRYEPAEHAVVPPAGDSACAARRQPGARDDAHLPGCGCLPDRLHRARRPGHRSASGGDHAVRRLLLPDGLSVSLRSGRVRVRGPEQLPVRGHRRDAADQNREKEGLPVVIRPWIQDFGYGPFPPYTSAQVEAEMTAAADNGAKGWMIWNARALFTESALGPPRDGENAAPVILDEPAASSSASPSASP